ncbi:uncharacterized protein LOC129217826 isoform X2 [Uloborus diversus]|uniref:uncharacterized protein LOC129217826 isoform X2 n=1 Tax=Uloborus diversus TaxID=327109 RepID=UPI00240A5599|nr:uncharacterized protein LOC129217826 isoform X2 [Uloborus diversus]
MLAHVTCSSLCITVIAGIVVGIYFIIIHHFHKAAPVVPDNSTSFDNHAVLNTSVLLPLILERHNYSTTFELIEPSSFSTSTVSAFPKPQKEIPPECASATFACQDLESARLCGLVKTCANDIWSTMSAPDDNDEICDICKEMVKEARDQLLSNMTQEEIKEVFEGSCKLLPIKLVADACIKVVDEIIPELVEMLASRMDPNMVCTVSGMCNPVHLPVENHILKYFKMIWNKHKDNQCTECTTMITDVQVFLKNTPQADVKTDIEKLCDEKIPKYLCNLLVNDYFPEIYSYLVTSTPQQLCSIAGVCPQKCEPNEHTPTLKDDLTCEFCEHVLQHIKDLVTTNTTEEEFRTALLNFCKHVGKFSDKCTSLVNDYYDMLFDYIRNLDTKGMCTLIGLCNNAKCSTVPLVKLVPAQETRRRLPWIQIDPPAPIRNNIDSIPLVKLVPARTVSKKEMKESNDIFQQQLPLDRLIHPLPVFEKDTECAFCKAISFYIQQDLNGNTSKVAVREAVDAVCEKWVKDFPDHCTKFVNKYAMKFQVAVAKGVRFEDVCPHMKACPLEENKSELNVQVLPKVKESPFCDLCKDAMNALEEQLSDPSIKQKLENLADQACNVLPKELRDDCNSFIKQNVDALIDILQQELKPDNICPALGLCSAKTRVTLPPRIKDLECDVCKDVVSNLRQKIEDPGSKKIVLTFLEEGCARLPGSLATECRKFVDENIDTVVAMIIQELDPDTVCAILNICPASLLSVQKAPAKVNDLECDLCKEVVQKVEDMIKDKKTEDEIKNALDKVCSYLPKSIADKCENFVNTYTDLLITLLAQEMDPAMVCAYLKVCPAIDVECQGCQYLLHFLQEQLMNTDTQGEVKNVLKRVCNILPENYAKNCEAFVDEYGDSLLVLVAQEIDPTSMCNAMKFCGNKTLLIPVAPLHSFNIDECSVCTTVVDYLDKLLEEDDVDKEITQVIEKVCSVLPSSYQAKCTSILETYGPCILQMIGQLADSKQVCQDIELCSRPAGQVHLVGGNKCTFGPSYWCKSALHASACKAEEYCKEKVLNN